MTEARCRRCACRLCKSSAAGSIQSTRSAGFRHGLAVHPQGRQQGKRCRKGTQSGRQIAGTLEPLRHSGLRSIRHQVPFRNQVAFPRLNSPEIRECRPLPAPGVTPKGAPEYMPGPIRLLNVTEWATLRRSLDRHDIIFSLTIPVFVSYIRCRKTDARRSYTLIRRSGFWFLFRPVGRKMRSDGHQSVRFRSC